MINNDLELKRKKRNEYMRKYYKSHRTQVLQNVKKSRAKMDELQKALYHLRYYEKKVAELRALREENS